MYGSIKANAPEKSRNISQVSKKSGPQKRGQKWSQIHLICNKQSCLRNFRSWNFRRNIFDDYPLRYTHSLSTGEKKPSCDGFLIWCPKEDSNLHDFTR